MNINRIDLSQLLTANSATTVKNSTDFASLLNDRLKESETNLDAIFEEAANAYNVPVDLLKAVAKAESNFHADATSSCGAMGIMQLMPGTARSLGVNDAYDPQQNIMGGAKYISNLLNQFDGDASLAIAAYNAGPGNVKKYNGIPPFAETQNYVQKVLGYCDGSITAGSIPASSDGLSALSEAYATATGTNGTFDAERYTAELRIKLYQMQMLLNEPVNEYDSL
jgi:hypothetical protein